MVVHTCNPSYSGGGGWRLRWRTAGHECGTLSAKRTKRKELGVWLKEVGHSQSKQETLGSTHNSEKKKKEFAKQ
jgi:hypothetical protein